MAFYPRKNVTLCYNDFPRVTKFVTENAPCNKSCYNVNPFIHRTFGRFFPVCNKCNKIFGQPPKYYFGQKEIYTIKKQKIYNRLH